MRARWRASCGSSTPRSRSAPCSRPSARSSRRLFAGRAEDTTEENLQARTRGTLLMALSNKFGWLVVTTGNKSEMATGYATLYGDMAGGYALIKDVVKTLVYRLSNWRNARGRVIPQRVIDRPPSAELRPDQTDQDSLPPYEVLDAVVEHYMERDMTPEAIVAPGLRRARPSAAWSTSSA